MPIIKSAKKQLKQNRKRRARNFPLRSELKTVVKKALHLVKEGNAEEAAKFLPHAYKIIDMACKKNLIHENNAARKKSRLAKALNGLQSGGSVAAAPAKDDAKKVAKSDAKNDAEATAKKSTTDDAAAKEEVVEKKE